MTSTQSTTDSKNIRTSHEIIASYLSAIVTTTIQTTTTHVLDTVSKRLQNNKNVPFSLSDPRAYFNTLYQIIYPKPDSSIWDGYQAAIVYRVIACTVTLGSQPITQKYLTKEYGDTISSWTGKTYQSTATAALSGALFGVIEVAFLPLDRWKLLRQINNTTPFFELVQQQKNKLYVGASITCVRNITAFSALFGVPDLINKYFSDTKQSDCTPFYQRVMASSAGAIAATLVSNPADVIKTIKQTQSDQHPDQKSQSSIKILSQIWEENGIRGLGRGLKPRLLSTVPRLTFLTSLSQQLSQQMSVTIANMLDNTMSYSKK